MVFTDAELDYLRSQRLGRLATLAPDGTLQNSPVGFAVDATAGVIDIRGRDLGNTRKFHNVAANGQVAFVVDDIVSLDPWNVRCFEVRGTGEALTGQPPPNPYMSSEVIRIHPRRIISWGMGPDGQQGATRNVSQPDGSSSARPAGDGLR
ncbi:MAG: PPOX class F420-dependent oxidoreductase [Streptosporangiaceae bacterium]|jgi:pyridoxamine 5'-phosphate oxidase family protein